jgi:hypothetical protein
MEFYLKVIKGNRVVFETQRMRVLSKKDAKDFVKLFKKTIRPDCDIILHEVIVKDGIKIKDWQKEI